MGQRSDGYVPIILPDKQPTLRGQRLLVQDLYNANKKNPSYERAVQLQKAQRDLSEITKLTVIQQLEK